jgi:hypothetical protein
VTNGLPGPRPGQANCPLDLPKGCWVVRFGAGVAAGRAGHDFYSMTSEMAGKCTSPLRRGPNRSMILVYFHGTGAWLGGPESHRPVWKSSGSMV